MTPEKVMPSREQMAGRPVETDFSADTSSAHDEAPAPATEGPDATADAAGPNNPPAIKDEGAKARVCACSPQPVSSSVAQPSSTRRVSTIGTLWRRAAGKILVDGSDPNSAGSALDTSRRISRRVSSGRERRRNSLIQVRTALANRLKGVNPPVIRPPNGAGNALQMDRRYAEVMAQRRASKQSEGGAGEDEKWLESMMSGATKGLMSSRRFREDSFLTEMYTGSQLHKVILPFSRFRRYWDIAAVMLVLYTAISLPVVIAFTDGSENVPLRVVDVITDLIFVADVIINFHTAFITSDAHLEIDKKLIARQYLTTWFPVDLVGSIPWEIITIIGEAAGFQATQGEAVQIVKILKAPKLLRLGRLFKFLARFDGAANIGRIIMLMFLFVLLLHWMTCIFYLITSVVYFGGQEKSWLENNGYDLIPIESRYLRAYYAVVVMIMGDNTHLQSDGETAFAIVAGLIGSCVNAIIFANVANLTAQLNASSSMHQSQMDSIAKAMRRLNVETSTARRIRSYYEYVWVRHRNHQGDEFIRSLPAQLRSRTSCAIHEKKLRTCPLFAKCERKFIAALSTTLRPEVYLPAEFIVVAGLVSRAMYFIARGRVQIIRRSSNAKMQTDECVNYFDEAGLFIEKQHSMYARAITHTDLYKLDRADFENAVKDFPEAGVHVVNAAKRYMLKSQSSVVLQVITDLVGLHNSRGSRSGTPLGMRDSESDYSGAGRESRADQQHESLESAPAPEASESFSKQPADLEANAPAAAGAAVATEL